MKYIRKHTGLSEAFKMPDKTAEVTGRSAVAAAVTGALKEFILSELAAESGKHPRVILVSDTGGLGPSVDVKEAAGRLDVRIPVTVPETDEDIRSMRGIFDGITARIRELPWLTEEADVKPVFVSKDFREVRFPVSGVNTVKRSSGGVYQSADIGDIAGFISRYVDCGGVSPVFVIEESPETDVTAGRFLESVTAAYSKAGADPQAPGVRYAYDMTIWTPSISDLDDFAWPDDDDGDSETYDDEYADAESEYNGTCDEIGGFHYGFSKLVKTWGACAENTGLVFDTDLYFGGVDEIEPDGDGEFVSDLKHAGVDIVSDISEMTRMRRPAARRLTARIIDGLRAAGRHRFILYKTGKYEII